MNERFTRAPHHNDRSSAPSPNAALLIDFDNVTMGIRSNLGQELRQLLNSDIIRGKVSVQRAYADWRRYPQYVVPLSEAAIDLIYAPAYGSSKKNATDIRLAIDALELVFTRPEIGTYILLSGDSDFSSLVLKLKEYGKYVIGVGMQESSSDLLVQNCDEYYSYDSLSGLVTADDMETTRHDPWELTEHSIKKMVERNDVMRSDRLKQVMLELDPSFDEKEIGYSKFNRFLTEASSRGILRLEKIGNGQYEVGPGSSVDVEAPSGDGGRGKARQKKEDRGGGAPPPREIEGGEEKEEKPSREREKAEKKGGDGGRGRKRGGKAGGERPVVEAEQLRAGYDLLQEVVSDLSGEDGRVRDSEVKREMLNRDSSFDEGALGFSKFSRFIRQAHDEEVVDITKDSDGNYYLAPVGGGKPAAEEKRQKKPEPEPEPEPSREERRREESGPSGREERGEPSREEETPDAAVEEAAAEAAKRAEPRAEEEVEREEKKEEKPESKSRGGGLRRRRKSKGDEESDTGDESWVPGPVDAGGGGGGETATSSAGKAGTAGGEKTGDESPRRRGVGRFRRGRKSGKGEEKDESEAGPTPGPVATDEGDSEADGGAQPSTASAAEEPSAPSGESSDTSRESGSRETAAATAERSSRGGSEEESAGPEGGTEELVQHMKERYSGVGEKTARKLVAEFGDETLSVIDEDPRRIENLLPKHRAEAVLQARAAERQTEEGAGGGRD